MFLRTTTYKKNIKSTISTLSIFTQKHWLMRSFNVGLPPGKKDSDVLNTNIYCTTLHDAVPPLTREQQHTKYPDKTPDY